MAKLEGIDWAKVAEGQLVPEGRHPARIDKIEERESQSEDPKPYWGITFTITDGDATGRKVWDVFMLEPQNLWKLRNLASECGIDLEGRDDLDSEELLSKDVGIVVSHDVYEGQTRNRVKGYFAV